MALLSFRNNVLLFFASPRYGYNLQSAIDNDIKSDGLSMIHKDIGQAVSFERHLAKP